MAQTAEIVRRLAFLSIFAAFGVMALKFVAWRLTGSVALYSDALESIVNVIAAFVAYFAIGYAHKPADDTHPFGHHKAEYFSAVIEGVLIIVAALLIVREAVLGLMNPVMLSEPGLGLAINGLAALFNAVWAALLIRTARQHRSPALEADGQHILSDVMTSVGVILGLGLALYFNEPRIDPVLALIVAGNVLYQGWKVVASSVNGLMDRALDPAEEQRIHAVIRANATGAIEAHDIRTRLAGQASFVEFHLVVDGAMPVEEAHQICDRLEAAVRAELPGTRVTIHVEPAHKEKNEGIRID